MLIYKELRKMYPMNQRINQKATVNRLTHIYITNMAQHKKPFFKYQLKLMKHILKYVVTIGKTTNIRFVAFNLSYYKPQIDSLFIKRGCTLPIINKSIQWLAYNLRY